MRDAVGRRLNRLTAECNELLSIAAVVGRDFDSALLAALSSLADDKLLGLLEEALAAGLLEEAGAPDSYRFPHALLQETLLAELTAARRVRLHAQIADALEVLHQRVRERQAVELASHFVEAAVRSPEYEERAARYSVLAAEQAEAVAGWDEAARHYGNCVELIGAGDGTVLDLGALLTALGRCQRNAGDFPSAWRSLRRAIAAYCDSGDPEGQARAVLEGVTIVAPADRHVGMVEEALEALGGGDPAPRARLHAHACRLAALAWDRARSERHAAAASELAAEHALPDVDAILRLSEGRAVIEDRRLEEGRALSVRAGEELAELGLASLANEAFIHSVLPLLRLGHLDEGAEEVGRLLDFATSTRDANGRLYGVLSLAIEAMLRCDWDRFEQLTKEVDYIIFASYRTALAELRGELDEALELHPSSQHAGGVPISFLPTNSANLARLHFRAGNEQAARASLSESLRMLGPDGVGPVAGVAVFDAFLALDDCLPALGDDEEVRLVFEELVNWPEERVGTVSPRGLDRMRGVLALRLDLVDEAERWFRIGLEWAQRERCPIEQGRNLEGLAEVAMRRGEHQPAMEHLGRAGELFAAYGAKLYLDGTEARLEELRAEAAAEENAYRTA